MLRRWLVGRAFGRYTAPPPFVAHRPPYLADRLPLYAEGPRPPPWPASRLPAPPGDTPLEMSLAGMTLTVQQEMAEALFERHFADTEQLLALHRFAWLPLNPNTDPCWIETLWSTWKRKYAAPDGSWGWHPYTAAERAINLIDYGRRHGIPAPSQGTLSVLAAHAPAIAARLEYFGEHHTSNHLANNGRGLYRLGLALGMPKCAEIGASILIEEANRIFLPSGILREGSSHYHLLATRNYLDAWLAAREGDRPEKDRLRVIAGRALAAARVLRLPGGVPLIGDISPDCPPAFLDALSAQATNSGWLANRTPGERAAIAQLHEDFRCRQEELAADGWLRADCEPWSVLAHAPLGGWAPIPGHGHQDCGAFELHSYGRPLFIDPGRGSYDLAAEADPFVSAANHNGLTVDDCDPFPRNRPYYDPIFRQAVCGPAPLRARTDDRLRVVHWGYSRFEAIGSVEREIRLHRSGFEVSDAVEGSGRHRIRRTFITPHAVGLQDGHPILDVGDGIRLHLRISGATITLRKQLRWVAYGQSAPATAIVAESDVVLPWRGTTRLQRI